MRIISDYPIMYIIACLFLGLGYAYFLYRKEVLLKLKKVIFPLFIIRTFFIALLSVLLLNPVVKSKSETKHKPIVILAQDISESISDSLSIQLLSKISKQLTDFEVHEFSFSEKVNEGFSKVNNGLRTNYSNLFQDFNSRFSNQNIAGVVLATDGLYNSGINPLYDNSVNFPIFPIALGDTLIERDVSITKVLKNDIVFLGNKFPLEISLLAQRCDGENVQVEIWNKGKKIHTENRIISNDDVHQKIKLYLIAENLGLQNYIIKITKLSNEKNLKNNSYNAYVEVIDSRYKILLLREKVHPDIAAYKSVLEKNKNYDIEEVNIIDFNGKFSSYQLVVIFGIQENNTLLNQLKSSKVPLLVFNINQNSNLNLTSSFSFKSNGEFKEVFSKKSELFSKFTFSPELINLIQAAPPLMTQFGTYNFKNGSELIIAQRIGEHVTSEPIIFLDKMNDRKLIFLTAEGFWKWKLYDYSISKNNLAFDELFSKLTQYLVLQDDKSKFRVEYKRIHTENSRIYFNASLYNDNYELINEQEITLIIQNEKGDRFEYEFSRLFEKYTLNLGVLDIGKYTFLAKVKDTELVSEGDFEVREIQLEQLYKVANHKLLFQLAKYSGGELFYPVQSDNVITAIKESKNNFISISSKEKLKGMINIPLILLILLSIIFFEWFLRKYNGLI